MVGVALPDERRRTSGPCEKKREISGGGCPGVLQRPGQRSLRGEVKSHLREDGLEQMKKILREFRDFFPEHKNKKIYGILTAVDGPLDVQEKVLREGIYLARIHDEEFELDVPEDFKPRAY
jgi:hypothetical protein